MTRRDWMRCAAAAAASGPALRAAPTSPVAVARCHAYGHEMTAVMDRMFDQLGGLGRIVKDKTIGIKINLTGSGADRVGHTPAELAQWTHPRVIGAAIHLMDRAGARRLRLLESGFQSAHPLAELMYEANWDPAELLSAAPRVAMENTNWLGSGKRYHKFTPAGGGLLFPEYWLNHSYEECDVFVSIAKMKEHATAGVTLSMKNLFGMTPCTIYGDGAEKDEPAVLPKGGRGRVFHSGVRPPSKIAAPEKDPSSPRNDKYRIPRAVADLASARPIHIAIIDGIATMAGGEGPWIRGCVAIKPGLLVIGTNAVTTDAVGTALMGFDPMAERGRPPFENCDSTLQLAESLGVGTRDLSRIEVLGTSIAQGRFEFRKHRAPATRLSQSP